MLYFLKKLVCFHDYTYMGMFYRIDANSESIEYNIYSVFLCKKCNKIKKLFITHQCIRPDYILDEITMYDIIFTRYLTK